MKTSLNFGGNTYSRRTFLLGGKCSLALAFLGASLPVETRAEDLIVNGTTQAITNGNYTTVIVENSGVLNVTGTLTVQNLIVVTGGILNVSSNLLANTASIDGTASIVGNITCSNFTALAGATSVRGTNNSSPT